MSGVGQVVRLGVMVRDENDADLNAVTVSCTLGMPDGTAAVLDVLNPPAVTGHYRVDYVPTVPGTFTYRWVTTQPATELEGAFYVSAPGAVGVLSLAEGKRLLRIPDSDTRYDEDIVDEITVATSLAEQELGQVLVRRTVVETRECGQAWRWGLALTHGPVQRVTLVQRLHSSGAVIESAADPDVWADQYGILRSARPALLWGLIRITYVAGPAVVAEQHRDAVRYLLQHVWSNRGGATGRPRVGGADDSPVDPQDRTAFPTRVRELLGHRGPMVG